ncbi:MAG: ABC transporter substrate-binding protein [Anaerolineae bacterium]|nr:ABC transporter substrate-binding protein [Anaerolineae bacterium]
MNTFRTPLIILWLAFGLVIPAAAQDTNVVTGCVGNFDPTVDYFPDKVELTHAQGLEIQYFGNYKVVRTLTPYPGAPDALEYVLVQCGTPAPEGYDGAQVIEVPIQRFVSLSTTQLPPLRDLGHLDSLIGIDSFSYQLTNTTEVLERIAANQVVDVGSDAGINLEVVLDLEPDVVMGNSFDGANDAHPVLRDAGVASVVNSEWLETTLLGRAEWIKFLAVFFNEEARANAIFDTVESEYQAAADLAAGVPEDERLTILWNSFSIYSDAWVIPGQQTWVGELLHDAGVDYVLMDDAPDTSQNFSFEAVFDAGVDAPVWIPNAFLVNTAEELLGQDSRYADFAAFQSGVVYNDTNRVNANGGNDFWETGINHPQLILQDLVSIFYPDLLPGHTLMFYKKLS